MLLNDEQKLGIKEGIAEGLIKAGHMISDRDQFLINITVDMTMKTFEKMNESTSERE